MSQSEYNHILHFCKVNGIPKPQRYPISGKPGQYVARFSTNRMKTQYASYKAAMNYCLSMIEERDSSGWSL